MLSKSRLSPIKQNLTIPRLELLGVLIGCRITKYVADHLGVRVDKQLIFTDSECVIEWYKSGKDLKRFVRDRIKEIRSYDVNIGYVSSTDNPADIASRGQRAEKLKNNTLWWLGPEWIRREEKDWHNTTYTLTDEIRSLIINEESGPKILYETGLLSDVQDKISNSPLQISEDRFSSLLKQIRVTAWCLRNVRKSAKH